jgi:protein-disulfide isomerase
MAKRRRRQETVQKRRQERAQKTIIYGSIVGVLILAALFIYYVVLDTTAPIPDDVDTTYEGIQQSMTNDGYGVLGDPTAPIEVVEFSSFACPHCKELQSEIKSLLPFIRDGEVRLTFVPIYNIAGTGADEGARAAVCAGRQGMFFQMHDVMFHWQGSTGYGNRNIRSAADQIGLDVDTFMDCYEADATEELVRDAETFFRVEMQRFGQTIGTPRITVDGTLSGPGQVYSDVDALVNNN